METRIWLAWTLLFAAAAWGAEAPESAPLRVSEGHFVSKHGYVSSNACKECHTQKYASWYQSYHRTMTQAVGPETVLADFDNVTLELKDGAYQLARRGDRFFVTLPDGRERPIAQSTGSHHYQLYWYSTGVGRELHLVPFAWLKSERRWVPRVALFLAPPGVAQQPLVWNFQCVPCHATNGRPTYVPSADGTAIADTRVAELGIACEACHGPGAAHAKSEAAADIVHPGKLPAARSAEVCGQCHSVNVPYTQEDWANWLLDGPRFRPGRRLEDSRYVASRETLGQSSLLAQWMRDKPGTFEEWFWPDGEVRVPGRELNALRASPCYRGGNFSCLNCHSPHAPDPNDLLTVSRDGNDACTQCHEQFLPPPALEAHTRHPAASAGSRCFNCHMPNTVYGLVKMMRSHQITSPDAKSDVETGRANACSLCHTDRPLGWAAAQLAQWTGKPAPKLNAEQNTVAAGALGLLTGDAGQRAMWAWHLGWEPAQAVGGRDWQAPFLAVTLNDPYDVVRYVAARSLRSLPGYAAFDYDFVGTAAERSAAADQAREMWIEIEPREAIPIEQIPKLLRRRDDRPMKLAE